MAIERDPAMGNHKLEQLSSLVDGELDRERAASLIEALSKDPGLQRQWAELQLVGDALRSSEVAACHIDGFCSRVRRALESEPTVLAPPVSRTSVRRWAVPGIAVAASFAALAFVAMPLLRTPGPTVTAERDAPAPAPVVTAQVDPGSADTKAAAAIANARALHPYFAAHRELTGGTPLPRATAYLRSRGEER